MKMLRELNQINHVTQLRNLNEEFKRIEKTVVEAYESAKGLPMDQLVHMVDVAKQALELAAQLPEEEQDYHIERVSRILGKVRSVIRQRLNFNPSPPRRTSGGFLSGDRDGGFLSGGDETH